MQLSAFVFDAYGTLFDVHAAVRRHAAEIGPDGQRISEIWRAKQLEYTWIRTMAGRYKDFEQITADSLDYALEKVPSANRALRDTLLEAYFHLDCYEEVPRVLRALKASGARISILSNGTPKMLESAVRSAALDTVLDEIFSVDEIRKYKTVPEVYEMVTTSWRLYPNAISFQSSNRWDVAGATSFGFRTVWINRNGEPDEYRDLEPFAILPSLDGLLNLA